MSTTPHPPKTTRPGRPLPPGVTLESIAQEIVAGATYEEIVARTGLPITLLKARLSGAGLGAYALRRRGRAAPPPGTTAAAERQRQRQAAKKANTATQHARWERVRAEAPPGTPVAELLARVKALSADERAAARAAAPARAAG